METLKIIKTRDEFTEIFRSLDEAKFVAFDTETTGLDKDAKIVGYSICSSVDTAYYVVLSYWDKELQKLVDIKEMFDLTPALLQALTKKSLLCHNAVFDCARIMDNFKIDLMPSVHTDTMLLAHLLDENRPCGLKELGVAIFDQSANQEQKEMKASVLANGGELSKKNYELYKADAELLGTYGAKDALLTFRLFYHLVEDLYAQGLQDFFYKDETMPQLRGPTYELNIHGLSVDKDKLLVLSKQLETECLEIKSFVYSEISKNIIETYPALGDPTRKHYFNLNSSNHLAWLLFEKLGNVFDTLTDSGLTLCKELQLDRPYTNKAKREFIASVKAAKGQTYLGNKKVRDYWTYFKCDKEVLAKLAPKYKWVEKLLEYKKAEKLRSTYVEGIGERLRYGVIHPNFVQHGTTSGRYSCKNPNFQNLPRNDKRVKACVVSRPGRVFVGADYSQLEPRVFASMSNDTRLKKSFETGDDFYSVIGSESFQKFDCSLVKDAPNSFAQKYPRLRDISKVIGLATTYGANARQLSPKIGKDLDETQEIIDSYFRNFPDVAKFMLDCHDKAKDTGAVQNLFGRPRRIPEARKINRLFKNSTHAELPYEYRNLLNLATNHTVQSTAASIVNRAMIAFCTKRDALLIKNALILMTIHDEIVVECYEKDATRVAFILKEAMEKTVQLPGVRLEAKPVIAKNLADLK